MWIRWFVCNYRNFIFLIVVQAPNFHHIYTDETNVTPEIKYMVLYLLSSKSIYKVIWLIFFSSFAFIYFEPAFYPLLWPFRIIVSIFIRFEATLLILTQFQFCLFILEIYICTKILLKVILGTSYGKNICDLLTT